MVLWVFQMVFNVVVGAIAFLWLRSMRQTAQRNLHPRRPEIETPVAVRNSEPIPATAALVPSAGLAPALSPTSTLSAAPAPGGATAIVETPLGSPVSTLSERTSPELKSGSAGQRSLDAYDKAQELLARGIPMREVARLTGLSLGELQLIGKVLSRNQ